MRGKRKDIQGLRALAVLLVIANHLFEWPTGGFIGVDIFFVISGFLITGLLVREHASTGRISFAGFYRRRLRRIVPAAAVVLVVASVAAAVLFTSSRAIAVFWDAASAFVFVSNWRFSAAGTDYFQWGSAPSPLQHFWSLSVEEQFYFVWPAVMLLLFTISARLLRHPASARAVAGVAMGIIVCLSFVWAMYQSEAATTSAYFSTFTRAWELGVGALLAIGGGLFARTPRWARTVMAYLGLVGIGVSAIVITSSSAFPAPWGALPVLSTAALIAAGIGGEPRWLGLLTNRASQYVGDISYSLYLWHFPVIIFLAVFLPTTTRTYAIACLLAAFGLAAASYHLVETPMNRSPFLNRFPTVQSRREAYSGWREEFGNPVRRGAMMFVAMGVVFSIGLGVGVGVGVNGSWAGSKRSAETVPSTAGADPLQAELERQIASALNSAAWPKLSPSASDAERLGKPTEEGNGCGQTVVSDPHSCAFGDSSKPAVVVLGDSLGLALLSTVRAAYGADHFVRGFTMAACPLIDLAVIFDTVKRGSDCVAMRTQSLAAIKQLRPAIVFVTNNYQWLLARKLKSGATGSAAAREWAAAAQSTAASLAPFAGSVVFVSPPPEGKVIADCATSVSVPASCVNTIPDAWKEGNAGESAVRGKNVAYLNTIDWYCGQSGRCPIFADGMPIKRDNVHPTKQWAERVAPLFKQATTRYLR